MKVYPAKTKMIIFVPIFNGNITMNLEEQLRGRSNNQCELCISTTDLSVYEVPPQDSSNADNSILLCSKCLAQAERKEVLDSNHWNCLTVCMWSEVPAVQVMSWRMLNRLRQESWAADSLDMMYLDDTQLAWAKATGDHENDSSVDLHKDCNGQVLQAGDSVVLIKSLDVKGSSLNAKMGTVVKNIKLVEDNSGQIEGKVEGQTIIILTKFVRKQH
jgi:protein PhnA